MLDQKEIRKHFEALRNALKEELERAYKEKCSQLDKLEVEWLGGAPADIVKHSPEDQSGEPRNVDRVIASLTRDDYKTVEELVQVTNLTESQVRGVLYSPSMDKVIERRKVKGEKAAYRLIQKKPRQNGKVVSAREAILNALNENPDGMSSSDIGNIVVTQITSNAKNPRSSVFAELHRLKNIGLVSVSENGNYVAEKR